jgi:hypothetical protein
MGRDRDGRDPPVARPGCQACIAASCGESSCARRGRSRAGAGASDHSELAIVGGRGRGVPGCGGWGGRGCAGRAVHLAGAFRWRAGGRWIASVLAHRANGTPSGSLVPTSSKGACGGGIPTAVGNVAAALAEPGRCSRARIRAVIASLLPFHGCRSGTGADRAPPDACCSSNGGAWRDGLNALATGPEARVLEPSNWGTLSTAPPERIHRLTHPAMEPHRRLRGFALGTLVAPGGKRARRRPSASNGVRFCSAARPGRTRS